VVLGDPDADGDPAVGQQDELLAAVAGRPITRSGRAHKDRGDAGEDLVADQVQPRSFTRLKWSTSMSASWVASRSS